MESGYTKEIWIGDYSILLWIPSPGKEKEIIQNYFNEALAQFGLKVVEGK